MSFVSVRRYFSLLAATLVLSGCAVNSPSRTNVADPIPASWQGRLSVKVWSKPVQAFSAGFELQGQPQSGSLVLTSVLGTTLARLHWDPSGAWLEQASGNAKVQSFASMDELVRATVGTPLPISHFFAWARGENIVAADWEVDLGRREDGRITARRLTEPETELLIILDTP